jgi:hypothetical protein
MPTSRRYTITEAENSFYTTNYRAAIKTKGNKKVGYSTGNFASLFPNSPVLNEQTFDDRGGIVPNNIGSSFKYNDENVIAIFKNVSDYNDNLNSPDFVGTDIATLNFQNKPVFDINEPISAVAVEGTTDNFNAGGYDRPLHGSPNLSVPDINNLPNYETLSSDVKKLNSSNYYYKGDDTNQKGTVDIRKSGGYGHRTFSNNTEVRPSETIGTYFTNVKERNANSDTPVTFGKSYKDSNTTQS